MQYLSLNASNNSGRASSISRDFSGAEARLTNKGNFFEKPYVLTFGLNLATMEDARKDQTSPGGIITQSATPSRNETQTARNFDQYVQGLWSFSDRWDLHAGVRHTNLALKVFNKLSTTTGSGELEFSKTTPVLGLVFKASPIINFYANVGKGFETPTLTEITYSVPATSAGPNFGIKPSTSTNIEVGTKVFLSDTTKLTAALFEINTDNEIVVDLASTPRASYKNAGKTKRTGVELSAEALLPSNFSVYAAYTMLKANFESDFTSNNNADVVKAGYVIPGTYRSQLYAEAAWRYYPLNFQTALEARYNSKVYVNDTNTDTADGYTVFSLRANMSQKVNNWRIMEYVRVDNIFNQSYIGSVRVNDSNSRFFEPAAGRNWLAGVKATYAF